MRRFTALLVSAAFALGLVGSAVAQTTTAPAPAPEKKMDKMEKKAGGDKKMDRMADCMQKAGTDDAKKAECEKKFAKKTSGKKDGMAAKKDGMAKKDGTPDKKQ
jgi:hypothetical protein